MNYLRFILLLGLTACELSRAREVVNHRQASPSAKPVHPALFTNHDRYREASITHRRFKHRDLLPLLDTLSQDSRFRVSLAGASAEGRSVHLITAGNGPRKVMLWSQMHGDESTATMAMLDIFNFLKASDELNPVRQAILGKLTVHFVPMLNPDGAERFQRRNALEIDLNRDAVKLQSPESRILKGLRDSLQPHFGFNLHDQSPRYTAGHSAKPATISFLAPPYDHAKSVNQVRGNAMKLIVGMNRSLQAYIPGQVAKYSDSHEPRAFGDNIQKWGTSVVLVESGGHPGDPEKQFIRKLNFVALLDALHAIAETSYERENPEEYYAIPENEKYLFDLVVRNVLVKEGGQQHLTDIGINRYEINAPGAIDFYYRSQIDEVGDMSIYYGYEEFDARGMQYQCGKIRKDPFKNITALQKEDVMTLLREGYSGVRVKRPVTPLQLRGIPVNVVKNARQCPTAPALNLIPEFFLTGDDGEIWYAVINGFIIPLDGQTTNFKNAVVLN
jgi:hypothetical protein